MTEKRWNAREEAALCLDEILSQKGYSSIVLDRRIRKYPPSVGSLDKALVTHLVYEALTHLLTIDFLLDQYSSTPVRKMKPYIASTLRIACTQLLYDDKIPHRAAIHEAVENVKHSRYRGLSGFVNGLLRAIDRNNGAVELPKETVHRISVQYSLPETIVRFWNESYGEVICEDIAKRLSTRQRLSVRVNTLQTTTEAVLEELAPLEPEVSKTLQEILYVEKADSIGEWKALMEGRIVVQNESAALAAAAVLAKPGMRILDLCAAPGGKSTFISQQMQNEGTVISCDLYPAKCETMRKQAERMGITCMEVRAQDGRKEVEAWKEAFDAVIVDAPCSGLGILRQKPDIRWNREDEEYAELETLQKALLRRAAAYVRPGGRLVYSTCTIRAEENEDIASWFLREHLDFMEAELEKDLPSIALCDTIKVTTSAGWRVILPEERGRDGFFIATFTKKKPDGAVLEDSQANEVTSCRRPGWT